MTPISLRIKEILKQRHMTALELARRLGKSPQYISNIINGKCGISINALSKVANVLEVDIAELFSREKSLYSAEQALITLFKWESAFPTPNNHISAGRIAELIFHNTSQSCWKTFLAECKKDNTLMAMLNRCKEYLSQDSCDKISL